MRKKSHISLSWYLINSMKESGLYKHRKAFYIGSVLPDCIPSFITRRHNIEETFEILRKEIKKLIEDFDKENINGYYCRHLGIITHYIADYFTFPHNSIYDGTLMMHCEYEKRLKFELRDYVRSESAKRERAKETVYRSLDDICEMIKNTHDEYLLAIKKIEYDINYIVSLCYKVVDCILQLFTAERKIVIE